MANEAGVIAYLTFQKGNITRQSLSAPAGPFVEAPVTFTVAGVNVIKSTLSVPTTAGGTAIPKGSVVVPGLFVIVNKDTTNFVKILNAVGGTVLLKLKPGEPASGRFDPTSAPNPAAIADTGAVQIEYEIVED